MDTHDYVYKCKPCFQQAEQFSSVQYSMLFFEFPLPEAVNGTLK